MPDLTSNDRIALERYIGEIAGNVKVNTALLHDIKAELAKFEIKNAQIEKRLSNVEMNVAKVMMVGGFAGSVASLLFSAIVRYFLG